MRQQRFKQHIAGDESRHNILSQRRILPARQRARTTRSNYNQFLQMLLVQLKNQDRLNPVDSAQFTQQLVSLSGVQQAVIPIPTSKN